MTAGRAVAEGLRRAVRHPGVVLWNWLVPLLPAAVLASMVSLVLRGHYDDSPSAARVLDGDWTGPWREFLASSEGGGVFPVLAVALLLWMPLTVFFRVVVSAGTFEVLLERPDLAPRPFWTGIGLHLGRFLRSAVWFGASLLPALVASAILFRVFRGLAASRMDGRFDLWGAAAASVVLVVLAFPVLLAYDFGRIAVARHLHGRTLRAFLAAMRWAVRRLGRLVVLYAVFAATAVAVPASWFAVRSGWSPASTPGIVALVVAGQTVLLLRAYLRVAFLGAEIAMYEGAGEPALGARAPKAMRAATATREPTPPRTERAVDFQI